MAARSSSTSAYTMWSSMNGVLSGQTKPREVHEREQQCTADVGEPPGDAEQEPYADQQQGGHEHPSEQETDHPRCVEPAGVSQLWADSRLTRPIGELAETGAESNGGAGLVVADMGAVDHHGHSADRVGHRVFRWTSLEHVTQFIVPPVPTSRASMLLVEDSRRGKPAEGLVDLEGIAAAVLRYLRRGPPTVGVAADGAVHRTLGGRA